MQVKIQQIKYKFSKIENLYLKFILTIIAIALIVIAVELTANLLELNHVLWRIYQVQ